MSNNKSPMSDSQEFADNAHPLSSSSKISSLLYKTSNLVNTVTFLDQKLVARSVNKNNMQATATSRSSKLSTSVPNKSCLRSKSASNIGKPIIRLKAHNYQIYLRITKQDKNTSNNATIIAHSF